MKVQKINNSFNGTYAELSDESKMKLSLVEQHLEEFKNYGISEDELENTKKMLEEFRNFVSDEEMVYKQIKLAKRRDITVDELKVVLRKLSTMFNTSLLEENSKLAILFEIENLSSLGYKDLLRKTRIFINMYNQNVTNGFGTDLILEIETLFKLLDKQALAHETMQMERKVQTQMRHDISNQLHKRIAKYCEIGKAIFMNTNSVMFESFNLYANIFRKRTPQPTATNLVVNYNI